LWGVGGGWRRMADDCGLEKQAGGEILGQDRALAEVAGRLVEAYVLDDAPAERRRSRLALWVHCLQPSCGRGGCSMPHDASVVGESKAWVSKAARDPGAATYGLRRRAGRCLN